VMRDRDRDQDARVLVNTWTQADLLAIDDLGVVGMHNWDSDNLSRLINERWKNGLPTVVTTNVADLKPLVGPRAASRMQDEATFVAMGDNDRRRNKRPLWTSPQPSPVTGCRPTTSPLNRVSWVACSCRRTPSTRL